MDRSDANTLRLFLGGDTMLGRGIDQILPDPVDPILYESYMRSARGYVDLAERRNGPIPDEVPFSYVWGDLLEDLDRRACDLRLINLETAITRSDRPAAKQINYRMSPGNIGALTAAGVDVCTLANNHVMDWSEDGLCETLDTLDRAGIARSGAGRDAEEAARPAVIDVSGKGRVLIVAYGSPSAGVPEGWRAGPARPGVNLLPDSVDATVSDLHARTEGLKRPGDLLIVSIHWGWNWGYLVAEEQRATARALIDEGGADMVFGHSSHHPKGVEVHRGKAILYGAGDLLNDYEGITGHEEFRPDLALAYVADLMLETGKLERLEILSYRRHRLSLVRADAEEVGWLAGMLRRESCLNGMAIEAGAAGTLLLLPAATPGP